MENRLTIYYQEVLDEFLLLFRGETGDHDLGGPPVDGADAGAAVEPAAPPAAPPAAAAAGEARRVEPAAHLRGAAEGAASAPGPAAGRENS